MAHALAYVRRVLEGRFPRPGEAPAAMGGCTPTLRPLVAAAFARPGARQVVWVCHDNDAAERTSVECEWYMRADGHAGPCTAVFPSLEVSPYKGLSPHPKVMVARCRALWRLLDERPPVVVTTADALRDRIPAPDDFVDQVLELRRDAEYSMSSVRESLSRMGYSFEDPVTEPGEFAVRGGILDVFPPSCERPSRVEFFGDYVESIRVFDPETQRSNLDADRLLVLPLSYFFTDPSIWKDLAAVLETPGDGGFEPAARREIRESAGAGVPPQGAEFLLAHLRVMEGSLLDYLDDGCAIVGENGDPYSAGEGFVQSQETARAAAEQKGLPTLPPEAHFHCSDAVDDRLRRMARLYFQDVLETSAPPSIRLAGTPTSSFLGDFTGLVRHLTATKEHVLFVLSSSGRCERLHEILEEYGIPHLWKTPFFWADMDAGGPRRIAITQGPLSRGFRLPEIGVAMLGSEDVFPAVRRRAGEPARTGRMAAFFADFKDLKPGDFVVHVDHGIGVFVGLVKVSAGGVEQEFASLEYADRAKLYVPVERMDLLQKHSGVEGAVPPLEKLGGTAWKKSRARVKKAIKDMADELLKLYAKRSVAEREPFPADDHWQREFEDMFEYDETGDQLRALAEIKRDMASPRPMDRLLCGDVGFGKTEVAMRAVFKALVAGKQAAVLAPTTVLAFQHFKTISGRFSSFPFRVDLLSRFRSPAQQKVTLADAESGKVDVVVGTHRLLSKDVRFHDLGLLVVDEEQRFGVTHKERIKKMRADVDVLTLSATPIPRTLYMSMAGIRDISLIETPPKDRLSIQTQVVRYSESVIRDAIRLELDRKGQVYFVHNRVETIHTVADVLRRLVPDARLAVAHGQMGERDLERVVLAFMAAEYDILLTTTIIENGVDIPLVNTIVINQAHRFGLSQLYQLRGRVGRSNRRAYAWLLAPPEDDLSDIARRRLAAIRDFTELGSGFRLAALDMELRGAGDVLGAEQHGHIQTLGFETYCRLMEEAVKELKGEAYVAPEDLSIQLMVRLRIPETYIPVEGVRLQLYKRIASTTDDDRLHDIREEVRDRFGEIPEHMEYLFEFQRVKIAALSMRVLSIRRRQDQFLIQLSPDSAVDPAAVVSLVRSDPSATFSPAGLLSLNIPHSTVPEMFRGLKRALATVSTSQADGRCPLAAF